MRSEGAVVVMAMAFNRFVLTRQWGKGQFRAAVDSFPTRIGEERGGVARVRVMG